MMLGGSGLGTITAPVIGGLLFGGFKKYGNDWAFFASLMFYSLFLLINIGICQTRLSWVFNNTARVGRNYDMLDRTKQV